MLLEYKSKLCKKSKVIWKIEQQVMELTSEMSRHISKNKPRTDGSCLKLAGVLLF